MAPSPSAGGYKWRRRTLGSSIGCGPTLTFTRPPMLKMENLGWLYCCCGKLTTAAPSPPRRRMAIAQAPSWASPAASSVVLNQTLSSRRGFMTSRHTAPYPLASPRPIIPGGQC